MTNKLTAIDKGSGKSQFLAVLRGVGGRAYITCGPVLGLPVIALFAIGFALSAMAIWLSRAEHSAAFAAALMAPAGHCPDS